jgi:hypothetical protein
MLDAPANSSAYVPRVEGHSLAFASIQEHQLCAEFGEKEQPGRWRSSFSSPHR